eukprot:TRINITY_DN4325_c0_g1_i6.p2 TRINITY_DN4325_c0_g1~~TRINITY_DN4325_c0_g1_i6.p2  ORF type:complete len:113 (-),score=44.91 TRINITY_DN4325_c0_g1_i6:85-423(-)
MAAGLEDSEMAQTLLSAKADINWRGAEFSFTALHQAACLNSLQMVEVLIAAGADADVQDESGSTALSLAKTMGMRLEAELESTREAGRAGPEEVESLLKDLEKSRRIQELLS